ncbi:MAG: hypothetical protein HY836_01475 [Aquabacterium sp.]|uniref:hypothetical protein n=1 Tax=Aquabacterium sp. TaxID=1872578 RepID=UPI0025B82F35|nr:hypothetical protein [Aquabacterium sp.]MBI5924244.1 hypothetical protein [Aquabacterium sp.]
MKTREVTLPDGQCFQVPQGIQRIDSTSTHGWQVRYQGTKLFSDGEAADPRRSLANALSELVARMNVAPASTTIKHRPSAHKKSDLPAGISGPIVRQRPGRALTADLSVLLPRFGGRAEIRNVYIGSQNTYTPDKYLATLEKCLALRNSAINRYEQDARKARKAAVAALKAQMQALRAPGP